MKLLQHWQRLQETDKSATTFYYHGLGLPLPDGFDIHHTPDIAGLRSHYAIADITDQEATLVVDPIRSFPLFYSVKNETIHVSDDPFWIRDAIDAKIDKVSYQQQAGMAFTLPKRTFYKDIQQLMPGERVTIDLKTGTIKSDLVNPPVHGNKRESWDKTEFTKLMESSFDTVMHRAITACQDSKILVPLSGGLDSRLLAIWLSEHKVPNVLCFTYGRQDSKEIKISEAIAKKLNLDWIAVTLEDEEVKHAWLEPETADFLKYCSNASALPHVQDWYAIRYLLKQGIISTGDVVFPGHTIIDNYSDRYLPTTRPVTKASLIRAICSKHFKMHPKIETSAGLAKVKSFLNNFFDDLNYRGTEEDLQKCIEAANVFLRQAMYINNSVRAYEYFGLRWAMPMLDQEFLHCWLSAPLEYNKGRNFFKPWVTEKYEIITGEKSQEYVGPAAKIPLPIRRNLNKVLRRTGITTLAERIITTKISLHHPMGFDLYATKTDLKESIRILMAVGDATGVWNQAFINDSWHPHLSLFKDVVIE